MVRILDPVVGRLRFSVSLCRLVFFEEIMEIDRDTSFFKGRAGARDVGVLIQPIWVLLSLLRFSASLRFVPVMSGPVLLVCLNMFL